MGNEKVNPNGESESQKKRVMNYVLASIFKIAAAFRVDLMKETQAIYLEQLSTYPLTAIETAVERTIREWDRPSLMPTIAFIVERIETAVNQERIQRETRKALPEAPPPDFDKEQRRMEFQEMLKDAQLKRFPYGISKSEEERRIAMLREQAKEITKDE